MSEANDKFRRDLNVQQSPAPWSLCDEQPGIILDANGADVVMVAPSSPRSDAEVSAVALAIVIAVNTCAGFKAEIE